MYVSMVFLRWWRQCTCIYMTGRKEMYIITILSFLLVKAGIVMCLTFFHCSRPSHSNIPGGRPIVWEFIRDIPYNRNSSRLYSTMEESWVTWKCTIMLSDSGIIPLLTYLSGKSLKLVIIICWINARSVVTKVGHVPTKYLSKKKHHFCLTVICTRMCSY